MTHYETLFIIHPEKGGRVKEFVDKFSKVVEGLDGTVSQVDEWGIRDLAYRIDKQARGFYTLMRYRSSSGAVEELERNMRLTDGVLRYLTVRLEDEIEIKPQPKTIGDQEKANPGTEEDIAKPDSQP